MSVGDILSSVCFLSKLAHLQTLKSDQESCILGIRRGIIKLTVKFWEKQGDHRWQNSK